MGIQGLSKVVAEHAPAARKENDIKNFFGRKIAIDASMSIYQFLIAVRSTDGQQLTNENGDTTSHLMGMFYRTIRMVENGIKPCYVFDGAPPTMKSGELAKRGAKRAEATKAMEEAVEAGDQENIEKFSRRTVKVTKEHNDDCQRLLELMGIPWMKAPCEAEAQCAALAAAGKVYGVGSEDLDTLTFGAPVLLRHLTFSEARKMPIVEMHYEKILEGLELNNDEFIDLCILLGCDYCDSIRGVGPHRAVQLIKEHRNIETILKNIDKKKYTIPDDWPFEEARRLFKTPDVTPADSVELKWKQPDEEGIIQYLVTEKGFNDDRVRKSVQKLMKLKSGTTQGRLDGFFTVLPKDPATAKQVKRKVTLSDLMNLF
ncbi:PIN domain-like protein [Globomyces pollinis-pini]|nr:PIN domain-like protein [Globomyces pollinis-pini]